MDLMSCAGAIFPRARRSIGPPAPEPASTQMQGPSCSVILPTAWEKYTGSLVCDTSSDGVAIGQVLSFEQVSSGMVGL